MRAEFVDWMYSRAHVIASNDPKRRRWKSSEDRLLISIVNIMQKDNSNDKMSL